LENELLVKNNKSITEFDGAEVLEKKRKSNDLNMGLSFDAISSIGANAAIIHYKPEKVKHSINFKNFIIGNSSYFRS